MSKFLEYIGWSRPTEPDERSRTRRAVSTTIYVVVVLAVIFVLTKVF